MHRHALTVLVSAAVLGCVAITVTAASAANNAYTQGDATALFYANGGPVVGLHNPSNEVGAFEPGKRIGPGQNFQGFHVCATDWHVMFINLIVTDSVAGGDVHTLGEAKTAFGSTEVTYALDGAPLAVRVTPVEPFLGDLASVDPNATVGYHQKTGAILAPAALSVGAHTERVRYYEGGVLFFDLGDVTFYVDAAGTGACL
jgi:hypothetical protein